MNINIGNEQVGIQYFTVEIQDNLNHIFEIHLWPIAFNVNVCNGFISITFSIFKINLSIGIGIS